MHQADWIGPRLAPWGGNHTAAIVVPAGFAAYARVLHPAEIAEHGGGRSAGPTWPRGAGCRDRDRDAQFHSIALPPADPARRAAPVPEPGPAGRQPRLGRTPRSWPGSCGTGPPRRRTAGSACGTATAGKPPVSSSPSLPPARGSRPRPPRRQGGARCPDRCSKGRGCSCRTGATSSTRDQQKPPSPCPPWKAPSGSARTCGGRPTAPGAWPARSTCRGPTSAAPAGLLTPSSPTTGSRLCRPAPDDRVSRVEDWVAAWADQLLEDVLAHGTGSLSTPRGSVDARLRPPQGIRHGELRIEVTRRDGGSSSSRSSLGPGEDELQQYRAPLPDDGRLDLTRM